MFFLEGMYSSINKSADKPQNDSVYEAIWSPKVSTAIYNHFTFFELVMKSTTS